MDSTQSIEPIRQCPSRDLFEVILQQIIACWWADGAITDADFTKGIEYLISNGIIHVL